MPLNSALYSIPYLIVFGLLWFLYLNEKGRIKNGLSPQHAGNIAFLLMLVFIGLRGHVYTDFINYYPFYRDLPPIYKLDNISRGFLEPGYVIFSSILKTIAPNYFVWVFINTLIDLLVFRLVFKRYTHSLILPFIFFMAYQGISIEFNLYRNAKAIDLFLLSLPYLQQRKLLPYMLLNLLGVTFHISAVIYLPLYFVLQRELPRWFVWSFLIIANVIFLSNIHFTSDLINNLGMFSGEDLMAKLGRYQSSHMEYGFSFGYFERTFSIIICTILYYKLMEQTSSSRMFYNCAFFYYLTFMIFSDVKVLTERIPLLLIFSYWILFSNIAVLKYRLRPVILFFLILISFLKVLTGSQNIMSSYDNLLWGVKSYEQRQDVADKYFNN
jgi:hypothetical protein